MLEFPAGRQFRGPRTRSGKRIRNRVGDYYAKRLPPKEAELWSRPEEPWSINDSLDESPVDIASARFRRIFLDDTRVVLLYAEDGTVVSASAVAV